ncbi:uncharacterized protein LOC118203833, partial [Stegodyphus dumicola]|uniref:uncharacterized protein LOC118203833 n=1 Tax=Stegodyphus dumicola TaxID=202533 RepID=UPI0015AB5AA4
MGVALLSFLYILAAASAATDYRNETVKCAFREYSSCYKNIEMLGASLSVMYAETENQLNIVCKHEEETRTCISAIPEACNALSSTEASNNVTSLIHNLCRNKTVTHG